MSRNDVPLTLSNSYLLQSIGISPQPKTKVVENISHITPTRLPPINNNNNNRVQSQLNNYSSTVASPNPHNPYQLNNYYQSPKSTIKSNKSTISNAGKSIMDGTSVRSENRSLIQQFKNETNPFYLGISRHDKIKLQGSSNVSPSERLYKYTTFSRAQTDQMAQTLTGVQKVEGKTDIKKALPSNKVIEEIMREQDILVKNDQMIENLTNLKQMNLLSTYQVKENNLAHDQRIQFVFNDYHSRATNNGYARNMLGYFYTK